MNDMKARPIRWGILGASKFALNHMAPAIHAARGGSLNAIATSDSSKARPFSDFAPGLEVYDSYMGLLDDCDIDAIYIPLPNHLHVEWAHKALEAGKHVLCEKPIAMETKEIDTLISLRDKTGLLVAEAYMIMHHPQWHYVKSLYEAGEIGSLVWVDSVFTYDNRDEQNIRNRAETGGGGIRDVGVYNYGCTRYVSGEEPCSILYADINRENQVDVHAQVIFEFPTFRLSATNSMRVSRRQEVSFHGEQGIIRLSAPFNPGDFGEAYVALHKSRHEVTVQNFPGENQYVNQVENFNRSIKNQVGYPCPLEFSRGTQAMVDMIMDH